MLNYDRIYWRGEKVMKKIYAFTFEGEDYLSDKFRNNLRLIAFLLYDYIYNYIGDDVIPLNINKNIVFNRIHESKNNTFYLDSDYYDDGFINYEPFIINRRCFALTVLDELISEKEIKSLLDSVLHMVNVHCNVKIFSECYFSKNKSDEKNRNKAINVLCERIGCQSDKKIDLIKRIVYGGKIRKKLNCCGRY